MLGRLASFLCTALYSRALSSDLISAMRILPPVIISMIERAAGPLMPSLYLHGLLDHLDEVVRDWGFEDGAWIVPPSVTNEEACEWGLAKMGKTATNGQVENVLKRSCIAAAVAVIGRVGEEQPVPNQSPVRRLIVNPCAFSAKFLARVELRQTSQSWVWDALDPAEDAESCWEVCLCGKHQCGAF